MGMGEVAAWISKIENQFPLIWWSVIIGPVAAEHNSSLVFWSSGGN